MRQARLPGSLFGPSADFNRIDGDIEEDSSGERRSAFLCRLVVAILDDNEATLKRYYREGGRIRLQPANKDYDPILVDECEIRGVVRGVLRKY